MGLFEGKTTTERNKMIAAGVLGVVSLIALYMAFGRSFFGGSATTATTKTSPTPKPAASPTAPGDKFRLPTNDEQALNIVVPVVYRSGNSYGAPDPGRNIFAFYEPPPATPYQPPPPTPAPTPVPATPTPTPVFLLASVNPQNVFAGSRGFKLEVNGDRFTPDARIYFNQAEMPTVFGSPQQLTANIPDNLISQEGARQIIVQTPDGRSYSFPVTLRVQAPPKPTTLQYIGMIGRARYNNDTAYFLQTGNTTPFGARLGDLVGGRFRIISISSSEVVVEDINLGFKHSIPIAAASSGATGPPIPFSTGNPRMNPTQPAPRPRPGQTPPKPDVDDNDDPDKS